jgi:hypothetical protein
VNSKTLKLCIPSSNNVHGFGEVCAADWVVYSNAFELSLIFLAEYKINIPSQLSQKIILIPVAGHKGP